MDAEGMLELGGVAAGAAYLSALALIWLATPRAIAADDGESKVASTSCKQGLEVTFESCEEHEFICSFEEFDRPIKLAGIRSPKRSKCSDESKRASARLAEILREAERVCVAVRLKYAPGRVAGDFYAVGTDLGARLVDEGHASDDLRSQEKCFPTVENKTMIATLGSLSSGGGCSGEQKGSMADAMADAMADDESDAKAEDDEAGEEDDGEKIEPPQCGDLTSCYAAYEEASKCDDYRQSLDPDGDGVPCEKSHCSRLAGSDDSNDPEPAKDPE